MHIAVSLRSQDIFQYGIMMFRYKSDKSRVWNQEWALRSKKYEAVHKGVDEMAKP